MSRGDGRAGKPLLSATSTASFGATEPSARHVFVSEVGTRPKRPPVAPSHGWASVLCYLTPLRRQLAVVRVRAHLAAPRGAARRSAPTCG